MPGILWVGTDDGNIQMSKDGGANLDERVQERAGIGEMYHINRVEPRTTTRDLLSRGRRHRR